MPRGTITLHQVAPEVRAKGAAQARQQLHTLLSNPHLTEEQRTDLRDRLTWVSKWEAGDVGEVLPPPPPPEEAPEPEPRVPQHHVVSVQEEMKIEDKGGS